jgi:hypothetical protein
VGRSSHDVIPSIVHSFGFVQAASGEDSMVEEETQARSA